MNRKKKKENAISNEMKGETRRTPNYIRKIAKVNDKQMISE